MIVTCPICNDVVSGQRFAPHLEKCMKGGKRGGTIVSKRSAGSGSTSNSTSLIGIGLPYYTKKDIIPFLDPYPNSLIIRIKLKNGSKSCQ
jgi:hypothetical protein